MLLALNDNDKDISFKTSKVLPKLHMAKTPFWGLNVFADAALEPLTLIVDPLCQELDNMKLHNNGADWSVNMTALCYVFIVCAPE